MTITVEDGTGLTGADAYISVEDADTYFLAIGDTTWSAADTTAKEQAIVQATRYMEKRFGNKWKGIIASSTQALGWPRDYVYDERGTELDDQVPTALANACAEYAKHGVDFLIDRMWDSEYGGFFWTVDRKGNVAIDKKILYGLSFAIYSLSEYTMATGDLRGQEYAERVFDLVKKHCADTMYGGYFEMFERNWDLCGPGSQGGDRKKNE